MRWFVLTLFLVAGNAWSFELYLLRHFEKQATQPDPPLTEAGKQRADSLIKLLADKGIAKVYSTDYQRTQQTAGPLAKALKISVTSYDPRDLSELANELRNQKQNSVIVGHSNTTPQLISLLGGEATTLTEKDYSDLFILIVLPDGKVLTQSVKVGNR